MRLLVTGGGGLVGRHVADAAAAQADVDLVVSARSRPSTLDPAARFVAADLSDADEAARIVRDVRPTHIVHTAWETRHVTYYEDIANLDWVASAARMAAAFAEVGGKRFVQVGSCAEYNWSVRGEAAIQDVPDRPATRYGRAKIAAFAAIEAAAHGAFEAVEGRIFWVFGAGENPARLIPLICRSHLSGTVPDLGSGRQLRDLVHAPDAGRALLALARADGLTGVVDIGTGEGVKLSSVATILARIAGASEKGLGRREDRPADPPNLVASADRLRSTGWAPMQPIEESLAQTFKWWEKQQ